MRTHAGCGLNRDSHRRSMKPTQEQDFQAEQVVQSSRMVPTAFSITPTVHVQSCPLCDRKEFKLFQRLIHGGVELKYPICCYCGLVFLSPRFEEGELTRFYQEEYRLRYSGDASPTVSNLKEQAARAGHLADVVKLQCPRISSHLDIGCSAGELLNAVRQAFPDVLRFRSVGIEPSEAHRAWCAQKNIAVFPSLEAAIAAGTERVDLISLSHVLEHISDPISFLRTVRTSLLSPNGMLLLEVPNLFGHASFEIAHLFAFTEKTLEDVLHAAGFKQCWGKLHSVPRAEASGLRYIAVLATPESPSAENTHPIRRVWWRLAKLKRTQWSYGLGSRGSDLLSRLPGKVWKFLSRRFSQRTR